MIEKSYSATEPSPVSVEHVGGHTTVWLRKNIEQDTADSGPDGSESVKYWSCDEVCFSDPGAMSESEASERFDELWSEHSGENVMDEAVSQMQALARMQVATMDLSEATCDEVIAFRDYWPEWQPDTAYKHNQPLTYQGRFFRTSKDLTSQAIYPPGSAESEYYEVTLAPDGIINWYNVGGEYNMVHKGETRHYSDAEGPVYRAKVDTSYSPDAYPDDWELA